jgi:hypothetical protein
MITYVFISLFFLMVGFIWGAGTISIYYQRAYSRRSQAARMIIAARQASAQAHKEAQTQPTPTQPTHISRAQGIIKQHKNGSSLITRFNA